jgi:hypothetical protein
MLKYRVHHFRIMVGVAWALAIIFSAPQEQWTFLFFKANFTCHLLYHRKREGKQFASSRNSKDVLYLFDGICLYCNLQYEIAPMSRAGIRYFYPIR